MYIWEEIPILNKEGIPTSNKEKDRQSNKKMGKNLANHFTKKEDIPNINKHTRSCPTSSVTKEMQIKSHKEIKCSTRENVWN